MTWNIRVLLGLLALAALLMAACGEDVAEPPGDEPEPTEEPEATEAPTDEAQEAVSAARPEE
jgi:outer membrane biogenesis lipoprotein LolB